MPFRVWTRTNSIAEKKTGSVAPRFQVTRRSGALHLAGGRLRRRERLEPGVGHRREAAAFHVDLRLFRPAPGGSLVKGEDVQRLNQLVVGLAHLDFSQVRL